MSSQRLLVLFVLCIAPLAGNAGASAATVTTAGASPVLAKVTFTAVNGETNNLTITGNAAGGLLFSDSGATVTAGAGCSQITASSARCVLTTDELEVRLGDGNDTLIDSSSRNYAAYVYSHTYLGGSGNDNITGSSGTNEIRGEDGDDTINGGVSRDYINAGPGLDTSNGAAGSDTINDRQDSGTLDGGDGPDLLVASEDGDTLIGGNGADDLFGGRGANLLNAIDGVADLLVCVTSADTVNKDAIDVVTSC